MSQTHNTNNRVDIDIHPEIVDELLTREMGKLSFKDRNAIYEEIHGVHCIAPDETPEFIDRSLMEMSDEIDRIKKQPRFASYIEATTSAETGESIYNPYVHDVDIRLRFLRCELFDVPKAAVRMLKYLDLVKDLFGSVALKRPIQLSDLGKLEMEMLRIGDAQPIPFRDRSGRRIMVACNNFGLQYPLEVRIRVTTYIYWAVSEDEESQRKGAVGICCWPSASEASNPDKFAIVYSPHVVPRHIHLSTRMFESIPIRIVGLHMCLPDKPIYHLMRSAMTLSFGEYKNRLKIHNGDSIEIQYHLHGYGIPIDQIPITGTGNIKTKNLHQWIRLRKYLESSRNNDNSNVVSSSTATSQEQHNYRNAHHSDSESSNNTSVSSKIDCPNMNDVVFRTKHAYLCHPGNAMFRGLIESYYDQHNNAKTTEEKVAVTWSIINEVDKRKGRFLVWDNNGFWKELKDRSHVRTKVSGALKDHKRRIKARTNHQINYSSTSVFQRQDNQNKKRKIIPNCVNSSNDHDNEQVKAGVGIGILYDNANDNAKYKCFGWT